MKTCPVCKTQVFDDMQSCFGCMHRFDDDPDAGADGARREDRWEIEPQPAVRRSEYEGGLTERGAYEPSLSEDGFPHHAWPAPSRGADASASRVNAADFGAFAPPGIGVRLEVRVATNPAQVWSAELFPTPWPSPSSPSART